MGVASNRVAGGDQAENKKGNKNIEIQDRARVVRRERLTDVNLVEMNAGSAEHEDAPADGDSGPKAAAKSETEQAEYSERQVGYGHFVLEWIGGRPAN